MLSTNPRFPVKVIRLVPAGSITHAVKCCPRCGCNMGISNAMRIGTESIICKGRLNGGECNGHYYLRAGELEFVGTV